MTKYKLVKDLPFAKAGTEWEIRETASDEGDVMWTLFLYNGGKGKWTDGHVDWQHLWGDPRESDWFEEVKPERWKAEEDGEYYYLTAQGVVSKTLDCGGCYIDNKRHDLGNYFQTKAQAEAARDSIKKFLKNIHNQE